MMYELIARNILRQLGIGKCHSGYDYIIQAIGLIFFDERFFTCVTKILYTTIAETYNTSNFCVEKNIRRVIHIIWENPDNEELLTRFFGTKYKYNKPSNKEFLGLMYEYIKSYNLIEEIFRTNRVTCPFAKDTCGVYAYIVDMLRSLC